MNSRDWSSKHRSMFITIHSVYIIISFSFFFFFFDLLSMWMSWALILVAFLGVFLSSVGLAFPTSMWFFFLSSYILFCYVLFLSLRSLFFSSEDRKGQKGSRWKWEWGGTGRTWGKWKYSQDILWEKNLFLIKWAEEKGVIITTLSLEVIFNKSSWISKMWLLTDVCSMLDI